MLSKLYAVTSGTLLTGYTCLAFFGWELFGPGRHTVPEKDRQTRGWVRSSVHTWHSGYRGGK